MNILSYNPGHDGAVAFVQGTRLVISLESEKDSNYRYSPLSPFDIFNALGEIDQQPDVLCVGGWWPREHRLLGSYRIAGYRGVDASEIIIGQRRIFGKDIPYVSSPHERSHILCSFGMSEISKGATCYALLWEGAIGAFYEISGNMRIRKIADVMNQPGNRYIMLYGLADPTFPKNAPFSRFSDAGKLMALTSFSKRNPASSSDKELIDYVLKTSELPSNPYLDLVKSEYFDIGLDNERFRNIIGLISDAIFDRFYRFARDNLSPGMPLVISGGCGLNCDWNSKWMDSGLFSEVFVPPVTNDSGAAIGAAIDAQLYFTGNPKIEWSVYAGMEFNDDIIVDVRDYDIEDVNAEDIAQMLAHDLILGWVDGKYEIGPRALGHRSILAAPFKHATRVRLNEIKGREQFRPIAPICLEEDAHRWFHCSQGSPFMLFTYQTNTDALEAVTHVNGTARLQTVSDKSNSNMYEILSAFKRITGYGVLCNTSLNFSGRGFINRLDDLIMFSSENCLDGFVLKGRAYLRRSSRSYTEYKGKLRMPKA